MKRRTEGFCAAGACACWLACAAVAGAQTGVAPNQPELKPVEAGRADLGPSGLSFRRVERDSRRPLNFDQVFQIAPGKFARSSGAVTAVFPRSNYVQRPGGGLAAAVPADTRFVIGSLPAMVPAPAPAAVAGAVRPVASGVPSTAERRADRKVVRGGSAPAETAMSRAPAAGQPVDHGMLNSERYRVRRIAELLLQAVDGMR